RIARGSDCNPREYAQWQTKNAKVQVNQKREKIFFEQKEKMPSHGADLGHVLQQLGLFALVLLMFVCHLHAVNLDSTSVDDDINGVWVPLEQSLFGQNL
ncbi:hypothetical protein BIW11_12921, partial [Tropilaelaps mercedesae]